VLLARLCERAIQDGALTLIDADGRTHRFGRASRPADVVVRLHDRSLHHRLLLRPSVALAEAYADGTLTVERGGVYDLLDLLAHNRAALDAHPAARIRRAIESHAPLLQRTPTSPERDRSDLVPESVHDCFLDWDRQSSCAYFSDPRMTLEEAQQAKKHHIASKLLLRPGQRVLDIGSGWGGLALHLADAEHVEVTGITLSPRELAVSRRRALEAELGSRVSFHLRDFQDERGTYDRVVSVGAFEQLRAPRYAAFFQKIHDVLEGSGVAVVHSIGRADGPSASSAWLRKYVSPDARVPALSEVLPAIERARLWVTDVEVLRLHYAETLRHWRRRFLARWDRVAARYDARRCRMWEFHLALAEAAFRRGGLMVFQLQLARRPDAVPLTRDYLYERTLGPELDVDAAA
jgi:cyclopropane-fatty-acyl-phospholipid synthase